MRHRAEVFSLSTAFHNECEVCGKTIERKFTRCFVHRQPSWQERNDPAWAPRRPSPSPTK